MMILCGMGMAVGAGNVGAATNEVSGLLQQGLFEEEANHNLDAAITAYQSVITRAQQDRQFEATAVFRLGECYRKLGRTNEANTQYQRILAEFPDQSDLATLSRQNLAATEVAVQPAIPSTPALNAANAKQRELLSEQIKLVQDELQRQENLAKAGVMPEYDTVANREKLLELQRQMALLEGSQIMTPTGSSSAPDALDEAETQKIAQLQTVIRDSPDLINGGPNQTQPLFDAVNQDWVKVAQFLLNNHADVNVLWRGLSPINLAASKGQTDMVHLFLDHGADADDANDNGTQGMTPLDYAARDGNKALAELLLAHRADVNRKLKTAPMFTPLHYAAQKGYLAIAELLLANGADANARGDSGQTPLSVAADGDYPAVMELLIAHHAEVDAKMNGGTTPLLAAARSSSIRALRLLLTNGANVNAQITSGYGLGRTALFSAADNDKPDMAKLLLDNHADPNLCQPGDQTPLMRAAEKNELGIVPMLLAHGADANAHISSGQFEGWTPLYYAIFANAPDIVQLLLENKADPNVVANHLRMQQAYNTANEQVVEHKGATPLLYAILRRQPDIVRILLAHQADPNLADTGKTTPLIAALSLYDTKSVELLLQSGANVNAQNDQHQSPVNIVVNFQPADLLKLILTHHPNLEVQDANGWSPLQNAIYNRPAPGQGGNLEAAQLLLEAGADPNAFNPKSPFPFRAQYDSTIYGPMVPLEGAVICGDRPMVELLLAHHADPNVLDGQGRTPLSWALAIQANPNLQAPTPQNQFAADTAMAEIVNLLRHAGANEHLQRLSTISVCRGWNSPMVEFKKGTNVFSHYTLFDLLTLEYSSQPFQNVTRFPFPDFSKIRISRVQPDGQTNVLNVNLDHAFAARDCSGDVPLQWGDLVEIPESDHKLNEIWAGPGASGLASLSTCLTRHVEIVVAGKSNLFALWPGFAGVNPSQSPLGSYTAMPSVTMRTELWLELLVHNANVLLTSSDLSRVTVKRRDPTSDKTFTMVFDLRPAIKFEDLWLRDGDVIEIPEKP